MRACGSRRTKQRPTFAAHRSWALYAVNPCLIGCLRLRLRLLPQYYGALGRSKDCICKLILTLNEYHSRPSALLAFTGRRSAGQAREKSMGKHQLEMAFVNVIVPAVLHHRQAYWRPCLPMPRPPL